MSIKGPLIIYPVLEVESKYKYYSHVITIRKQHIGGVEPGCESEWHMYKPRIKQPCLFAFHALQKSEILLVLDSAMMLAVTIYCILYIVECLIVFAWNPCWTPNCCVI